MSDPRDHVERDMQCHSCLGERTTDEAGSGTCVCRDGEPLRVFPDSGGFSWEWRLAGSGWAETDELARAEATRFVDNYDGPSDAEREAAQERADEAHERYVAQLKDAGRWPNG